MRPLRLSITAFGPFPGTEEIDFTQFSNQNIFLITGPTGGGKTSVFDAVCFALYGEASGGRRETEGFKSDFAPDTATCSVTLRFSIRGREFTVTRTPRQWRQNRKGENVLIPPKAELTLPEGEPVTGVTAVNERIHHIMGLDAGQFKQTAMLAQGEFQRFLTASSREKQEIFRRIFDTGLFERLSAVLAERFKKTQKELEDIRAVLQNLSRLPELSGPKVEELLAPQYPDYRALLELISQQIEEYTRQLSVLPELIEAAELARKALQLEERRANNLRLEQLGQLKTHLNALEQDSSAREEEQLLLSRLDAAAALQGSWEALSRSEAACAAAEKELLASTGTLSGADRERRAAGQALLPEGEVLARRSALMSRVASLSESLSQAAALEAEEKRRKSLSEACARCEKNLSALRLLARRFALQEELTQLNGLGKQLEGLQDLHRSCISLADEARGAKALYDEGRRLFLSSQAGILAASLRPGIPCPVCGSPEHPAPAALAPSAVSQAELERRQKRADALAEKLSAGREALAKLLERWELLCPGSGLGQGPDGWSEQQFSEQGQVLARRSSQIQRELDTVTGEFLSICPGRDPDDPRYAGKEALEDYLQKAAQALEDAGRELKKSEWEIARLKPLVQGGREEQARALQAEKDRLKSFEAELARQGRRLQDALAAFEAAKEAVRQTEAQARARRGEALRCREEFSKKLASSVLNSEEDFLSVLKQLPMREELSRRLAGHQAALADIRSRIQALSGTLTEQSPADLPSLEEKDKELREKAAGLQKKAGELSLHLERLCQARQSIQKALERFEALDKVFRLQSGLASLTDGSNPRKISFERYVLAFYFDSIIFAANRRLGSMTKGRYGLRRKEGQEKYGRASGLELEIADSYSGKFRDVSTLSGGESFQTSLALALSLADVVQAHAGGVSIETMFIDEGFGSLDPQALESAVAVLMSLKSDGRLVGVISHVAELKEWIPAKVTVSAGREGSRLLVSPA